MCVDVIFNPRCACMHLPETIPFKSYAVKHDRKSQYANLPMVSFSQLDTQRNARGYPTIVNNIQPCPKWCLLMPLPRVGARTDSTTRYSYIKREAWPTRGPSWVMYSGTSNENIHVVLCSILIVCEWLLSDHRHRKRGGGGYRHSFYTFGQYDAFVYLERPEYWQRNVRVPSLLLRENASKLLNWSP